MRLVLDTNVYCDFAEGREDVADAFATYGQFVFIHSVVLGELLFGFMKGKKQPLMRENCIRLSVD